MTFSEIKELTRGNADAERFVAAFVEHCHMLDDLVDRDNPCDDERMIASEIRWVMELTGNPFFLANRAFLVPLIVQGFNAWLDSNDWQQSDDPQKQRDADVLKGLYHEVIYQVAFLCGGWDHLRSITSTYRNYNHDYAAKEAS
jgi:hypothetical protein